MEENYTFETRHVNAIAWNSSGTKVAITTSDWGDTDDIYVNHRLKIIDANSDRIEVDVTAKCDYFPNTIAWRKEDTEIVLISVGCEFRCFDVQAECRLVNQWETDGLIQADFNPSRTQVAFVARRMRKEESRFTDEPEVLEVCDTDTGTIIQSELLPLHENEITDWFGWSPDGTRLALTNRKGNVLIYKWNGAAFSFQHEFTFVTGKFGLTYGAWGVNDSSIALGTSHNRSLEIAIYDIVDRSIIHRLDQAFSVGTLAWNPTTNLIAGRPTYPGPDYLLKIWDATTGQIAGTGGDHFELALAWSHDGRLAVGSVVEYEEWLQDQTKTGLSIYRPQMLPAP